MELDSLPKVIKTQTKPGVPRGMGLRGVTPWSMPLLQVLCVWSRDQKGKLHRSSGIPAFPPSFLCPDSKNGLGFFSLGCHGDPAELSSLFLEMELLFHPPTPGTRRAPGGLGCPSQVSRDLSSLERPLSQP